jgi:pimeloyl-ACP methyl ester carboxylesterase
VAKFVLIHGGGHRSWHWRLVRPILEEMGHRTVAPDVPMDDPETGAQGWTDVAAAAMKDAGIGDDAIVVGHSLAGLMLPVLASQIPVRRIVFLAANVPVPGISYNEYMESQPDAIIISWDRVQHDDLGRIVIPWDLAREAFYPDVEESLAREAFSHCLPTAPIGFAETCPVGAWPGVPSSYVLCQEDIVNGPAWARRVSLERLGGPAIELPGGHSPMLAGPARLAEVLNAIASLP